MRVHHNLKLRSCPGRSKSHFHDHYMYVYIFVWGYLIMFLASVLVVWITCGLNFCDCLVEFSIRD